LNEADFVHLHNHSDYSLLDGACKVQDLVEQAAKLKMPAVALTDHGALFGAIEFYEAAKQAGIQPIIGCELYICKDHLDRTTKQTDGLCHLVVLAKDQTGWKNLVKLSSLGYTEGFYYRPRIDHALLEKYHQGLIVLSACWKGEIAQRIRDGDEEAACDRAAWYSALFGDDFYLEIQRHDIPHEDELNRALLRMSHRMGIPLVATNDMHYLRPEHAEAHDALLCIGTGSSVADEQRMRFPKPDFYFKTAEEMAALFTDLPEALRCTREIAEKVSLTFDFRCRHLPRFPLPEGEADADSYLYKLAKKGLETRFAQPKKEQRERLDYELRMITEMGFAGYFLIVADFCDFARRSGIPVGPGRGSAAGSLVCYSLGITDLDPLQFDLYFERFLNPERISMPDIDIDFHDAGRAQVIEYVKKKYGSDSVTQIITFGRMKARAVIRDVGRVLGIPYGEVDKLARKIPEGPKVKLQETYDSTPELRELVQSREEFQRLWRIGLVLEGVSRHASTHAAGVVITPGELTDYVPLYRQSDGSVTTQFDMNIVADIGLLKMDFLGLRTLQVLDTTVQALRRRETEINLGKLPLDDKKTYALLARGETTAVFQLESAGMREWLMNLQPSGINDLVAMVALYRPGPMQMIGEFVNRRHGKQPIKYLHPKMEPILKSTYGVIVYQEQVLRIARDLAGFTLGRADILRRAMGKKKRAEMAKMRKEFVDGCKKHSGIREELARQIFDLVERFSEYGFVKAHAASYALLAYQTAHLKTHWPAEFMAAEMSSWRGEARAMPKLIEECRRMGLKLLPPDVNRSDEKFSVVEGDIRCGLESIKNVGSGAVASILEARAKSGPFKSFFDFSRRMDSRHINRKVLESLILSGALDSLGGHRAQYMALLDGFLSTAQRGIKSGAGQFSMFDGAMESDNEPRLALPEVAAFDREFVLKREKDLLGDYVSGHPLEAVRGDLEALTEVKLGEKGELADDDVMRIGGLIASVRRTLTKRGNPMATVTLEDFTGSADVLVFGDALEVSSSLLTKDRAVVIVARVSAQEDKEPKFVAQEVYTLEEARIHFARGLQITLNSDCMNEETMNGLEDVFIQHSGNVPIFFRVLMPDGKSYLVRSRRYRLETSEEVIRLMQEVIGTGRIQVSL
jgi:DNA polymerase-3 subunit alpha